MNTIAPLEPAGRNDAATRQPKRLMIMAAGTGGHIYPGLAIAATMRARGWQVSWLGTAHGMENQIVPRHGIEMDTLDFSGMRGKGLRHTLDGAFRLTFSFARCLRFMAKRRPDIVLGMGGYVTVPGGLMARLRRIPLVLVNADAALLLSNKTLIPLARRVLFGFPAEFGAAAGKASVTGNPVRAEILALPAPQARLAQRSGALRLLVIGGSLGAKVLNDNLPAALALMAPQDRPLVVHQSGKQHIDALRAAYAGAGVDAELVDFIDDMPRRYNDADLVICRAGAITVSELTAAGVASVLVPLVAATTSHQRDNARWMAQQKAAIHLPQTELTPAALAELLTGMRRSSCLAMAQAAYALGRRDANEAIAAILEQLTGTSAPTRPQESPGSRSAAAQESTTAPERPHRADPDHVRTRRANPKQAQFLARETHEA
jgi:UDP-N-acetylglucosamine--N-acetylmuramyl-(pentapeptide) pyrophosphoryl-undecaprenol N-acetylglucosamine transferase